MGPEERAKARTPDRQLKHQLPPTALHGVGVGAKPQLPPTALHGVGVGAKAPTPTDSFAWDQSKR